VRPAVEAALAVAREGVTADPPVLPPPGLQRYLGFTKLSGPALAAIARVVDSDDEFRARVADAVDEGVVGKAGLLWLRRPDGWADELARIEAEGHAAAEADADQREERDARRKLAAVQAAADRASAAAQVRAAKLDEMRAELAAERSRRAVAEKRLLSLEAALADREAAHDAVAQQLAAAEAKVAEMRDRLRQAEAPVEPSSPAPEPGDEAASLDRVRIRDALQSALRRVGQLTDALHELEVAASDGTGEEDGDEARKHVVEPSAARPARPTAAKRHRVTLPPGMRDDSVDAVDLLLRVPGMLLLVDGYNVSMVGWPDVPVHEQRRHLLAALEEKALRTGAPIEAVFDGADVDAVTARRPGRQLLRVRFSPPGVEADDVLLDMVAQLPPRRPVTVASSDKRVREGARAHGANLLHARQLLAALRR